MSATTAAEQNAHGVWLCEQDRLEEAIESFQQALRLDPSLAAAHYNFGNALIAAGRSAQACAAYRNGVEVDPDFPLGYRNLGLALLEEGDLDGAVDALRRAVELDPQSTDAISSLAIALLRQGNLSDALSALESNLVKLPNSTRDLALKAVALERLGDLEGLRGLLDFDGLIQISQPPTPAGYEDISAFNTALTRHLLEHSSLDRSTVQHATRGGRHSGELLLDPEPVIAALEGLIQAGVEHYLETTDHPFLTNAPDSVVLTAWAVVLDRGGYQIPHIHPAGWLSGVYYLQVPQAAPERPQEGWIEFGRPDPAVAGSTDSTTRLVRPEAGTMVLFPAYFYHCTVPFEIPGPRISIAFDVMSDLAEDST